MGSCDIGLDGLDLSTDVAEGEMIDLNEKAQNKKTKIKGAAIQKPHGTTDTVKQLDSWLTSLQKESQALATALTMIDGLDIASGLAQKLKTGLESLDKLEKELRDIRKQFFMGDEEKPKAVLALKAVIDKGTPMVTELKPLVRKAALLAGHRPCDDLTDILFIFCFAWTVMCLYLYIYIYNICVCIRT